MTSSWAFFCFKNQGNVSIMSICTKFLLHKYNYHDYIMSRT